MLKNEQILLEQSLEDRRREFAPEKGIEEFFEYFSAECVLYEMNIGTDKIQQGNVDGTGDGGVDSFYCFLNDELVSDKDKSTNPVRNKIDIFIIQSKYTNGFQLMPVSLLGDAIATILNLSIDENALKRKFRPNLVRKILQFREIWRKINLKPYSINIHAHYCANSDEVNPNVREKALEIESSTARLGSTIKCKFSFTGSTDLITMSHRLSRIECAELELIDNPLNPKQGGYIAVTTVENYYNFISAEGKLRHALFDMNVRDYQKDAEVNAQINETLINPGKEDFWWLNNGVSIIASEVRNANMVMTMDYPQIVNGLQTSYEIHKMMSNGKRESAQKNMLIRVVEIPVDNKASRDKIIRATNSQTQLPPSSFRSTEDIHRYIETYFQENNLYYDRRRSHYSNKGVRADQIISIEYLVQCVMAIILGLPFKSLEQEDIYSKDNEIYPRVFNELNLPTYLKSVLLVKVCERYVKDMDFKYDHANIKFYLAYCVAGVTCKSVALKNHHMDKLVLEEIDESVIRGAYNMLNQLFSARNNLHNHDPFERYPDFTTSCKRYVVQMIGKLPTKSVENGQSRN
jgi:AIPR protein